MSKGNEHNTERRTGSNALGGASPAGVSTFERGILGAREQAPRIQKKYWRGNLGELPNAEGTVAKKPHKAKKQPTIHYNPCHSG